MKNINISDSEWEVMKVLWEKESMTLKEIFNGIDNDWSYSTIRTLVNRLIKKGAVIADKASANFKYSAGISEKYCKKKETENFMSRVFDNSISMMFASLTRNENLTEDEYKQLLELVEKMDRGNED